jgi:hypothetical protein
MRVCEFGANCAGTFGHNRERARWWHVCGLPAHNTIISIFDCVQFRCLDSWFPCFVLTYHVAMDLTKLHRLHLCR